LTLISLIASTFAFSQNQPSYITGKLISEDPSVKYAQYGLFNPENQIQVSDSVKLEVEGNYAVNEFSFSNFRDGVEEYSSNELNVKFYGFGNELRAKVNSKEDMNLKYRIIEIGSGKIIDNGNLDVLQGSSDVSLDAANLKKNMYLVDMQGKDKKHIVSKVIKLEDVIASSVTKNTEKLMKGANLNEGQWYFVFSQPKLFTDTVYFDLQPNVNVNLGNIFLKDKPEFSGVISNGKLGLSNLPYVFKGDTLFTDFKGKFYIMGQKKKGRDTLRFLAPYGFFDKELIVNYAFGDRDFGTVVLDSLNKFFVNVYAMEDKRTEYGLPGVNTPVPELTVVLGNDTTYTNLNGFAELLTDKTSGNDTLKIIDPTGHEGMGKEPDTGRYSKWFVVDYSKPGEVTDKGDPAVYLPKVSSDTLHGMMDLAWTLAFKRNLFGDYKLK